MGRYSQTTLLNGQIRSTVPLAESAGLAADAFAFATAEGPSQTAVAPRIVPPAAEVTEPYADQDRGSG